MTASQQGNRGALAASFGHLAGTLCALWFLLFYVQPWLSDIIGEANASWWTLAAGFLTLFSSMVTRPRGDR